MAENKEKRKRLALARPRVLITSSAIVLCLTATAAAAYFMGGVRAVLGGGSPVYGLDCTLIDRVSFQEAAHVRWAREFISVDNSDDMARVLTGLRVARATAATDHADLVLVVVADKKGPDERPRLRGSAVGARVIYAPNPARIEGVSQSFTIRYRKGKASGSGAFYGDIATLSPARSEALSARMKKPYGCTTATNAEAKETSEHGKKPTSR